MASAQNGRPDPEAGAAAFSSLADLETPVVVRQREYIGVAPGPDSIRK
jgi:hypothetical protein